MSENDINIRAADRYSFLHFGAGIVASKLNIPPLTALTLAILFEIIEPPLKLTFPNYFPHPVADSTINKLTDIGFFMIGFSL